jgi:hypothetical protein
VVRMMVVLFWDLALCSGKCFRASALKMERICFSETLASTDESIWCKIPEKHHHLHCIHVQMVFPTTFLS